MSSIIPALVYLCQQSIIVFEKNLQKQKHDEATEDTGAET
jgi:hypothetical protein